MDDEVLFLNRHVAGETAQVAPSLLGFTADGLPSGLEIIGAPYTEAKIIALAQIVQQETDWHRRRPPV
jgi:Asp-tRNA(Asn)/Glu-tRNA(Gln) amidotransferase A subunit family amidase